MKNLSDGTKTNDVSVIERIGRVRSLDLGPIKFKLVHGTEGQKLDPKEVEKMETAYRRFLILSVKYPGQKLVPNKRVDTFWHTHILDTMKYAVDCEYVFGHFLHHFPYFGLRGEEDAKQLSLAFEETKVLYQLEFGETITESAEECQVSDCDAVQCNPAGCHGDPPEHHRSRPTMATA